MFAGIGNGRYNHFSPTGTLLETLDSGQGGFNSTGMCFDAAGNLYGTNFSANSMSKFTNNGTLVGLFGSFNASPESCLVVGNIMYTSQVFGTGDILKFNLSGTQLANYDVARSDWSTSPPISARCSIRTRGRSSDVSTSARTRLSRTS